MNTAVEIAGVRFKNPIITASGTFGFGSEYGEFYPLSALGGICTKGLTINPKQGNPPPRATEVYGGMLNAVGLQNPGVEHFLATDDKRLADEDVVVIANVAGATLEDYIAIGERINDAHAQMVELNISCPNVTQGGMAFGVLPSSVEKVTAAVVKVCKKPVITKLSPNVANIADNARAAEAGGAAAVSLINTLSGMAVNWKTRRPILANNNGGMSGPCVKPVALKMVWDVVHRRARIHDLRRARRPGRHRKLYVAHRGVRHRPRPRGLCQTKRYRYQRPRRLAHSQRLTVKGVFL